MDVFSDNTWVQENRIRVPIQHPRFDLKFAPYLVPLDISKSMGSDILKQSVQLAHEAWDLPSLLAYSGQPVAGWAITDSKATSLANHWANYTHLHTVNRLTKLLRFHDPSVREWLWPSLSVAQQALLLGPATQLLGIGRQQQLMQLQLAEPSTPSDTRKLFLTGPLWQQLEDYATVHEAWLLEAADIANTGDVRQWRNSLPTQWHESVFKALQSATQYGIESAEDRVLFARHVLEMGSGFHTHPLLKEVWSKTKTGGFYGGAVEEVTGHAALSLATHLHTVNS